MKWRWVILFVIPALSMVAITVIAVAILIPIRFTTAVPGKIVPKVRVRVTAARSGLIVFRRDPGPVEKGDVLLRQSTSTEQRRIQAFTDELALLGKELQNQMEVARVVREAAHVDLAIARITQDQARADLEAARDRVPTLDDGIESKQLERRRLQQTLAEKEYAILEKLAKQQSVPRQEVVRGETAAATARLQVEETELTRKKNALVRANQLAALQAALRKQEMQVRKLEGTVHSELATLEIRRRVKALELQLEDIRADVEAKEVRAPGNGEWGGLQVTASEYAPVGTLVGVFTDTTHLKFVAVLRSSQVPWVHRGQTASIRLDAFPYLKYGKLDAKVANFERVPLVTGATAALDGYHVEFDVSTENQPYTPLPGLTGRAEVHVFRGTLVQYLLAEPEQIKGVPVHRARGRLLRLLRGR